MLQHPSCFKIPQGKPKIISCGFAAMTSVRERIAQSAHGRGRYFWEDRRGQHFLRVAGPPLLSMVLTSVLVRKSVLTTGIYIQLALTTLPLLRKPNLRRHPLAVHALYFGLQRPEVPGKLAISESTQLRLKRVPFFLSSTPFSNSSRKQRRGDMSFPSSSYCMPAVTFREEPTAHHPATQPLFSSVLAHEAFVTNPGRLPTRVPIQQLPVSQGFSLRQLILLV